MFFPGAEQAAVQAGEGVTRRVLAYSDALMLCEISFEAGAVGAAHVHPHTQATYVQSGRVRFTLEGQTRDILPGDSVLIPPNALHSAVALEPSVLLDVFTPARQDFVNPE